MSQDLQVAQEKELALLYAEAGGTGMEGISADDMSVPYIGILQALSPQVKKGHALRIPDAEEGDLYNNVTKQVWPGETGIIVIPCHYAKRHVEWITRDMGGGFVKSHDDESIIRQTTRNDKNRDILPNGNEIATTAYHSVLVVEDSEGGPLSISRAVISMIRTQLKKSRAWNSQMASLKRVVNGKLVTPPSFASMYKLTTKIESRNGNDYFNWSMGPAVPVTNPDVARAAVEFFTALRAGTVQVKPDAAETNGSSEEIPF